MVYGLLMIFNIVYTLFFAVAIVCLIRGISLWVLWAAERRSLPPAAARPDTLLESAGPVPAR